MANKYVEKCLTLLAMKEMQTKIAMRYPVISVSSSILDNAVKITMNK